MIIEPVKNLNFEPNGHSWLKVTSARLYAFFRRLKLELIESNCEHVWGWDNRFALGFAFLLHYTLY
jgi:hypothetical protein